MRENCVCTYHINKKPLASQKEQNRKPNHIKNSSFPFLNFIYTSLHISSSNLSIVQFIFPFFFSSFFKLNLVRNEKGNWNIYPKVFSFYDKANIQNREEKKNSYLFFWRYNTILLILLLKLFELLTCFLWCADSCIRLYHTYTYVVRIINKKYHRIVNIVGF